MGITVIIFIILLLFIRFIYAQSIFKPISDWLSKILGL